MTEEQIRAIIRDEISILEYPEKFTFNRLINILDGRNIQAGTGTGTKIGTSASQKLGFYGKTPIAQQGAIGYPTGGATVDGQARSCVNSLIDAIKNIGITL
jgi:hypothetical protein